MPHVNIKHFPLQMDEATKEELVNAITQAVKSAFNCPETVISIALEPVEPQAWTDAVVRPEIEGRKELLCKAPRYG